MKAMALDVLIQVPQDRIAAAVYHTTIQQSRKRGEERVLRKAGTEALSLWLWTLHLIVSSLMLAIEIFSKALALKFRDTFPFISLHAIPSTSSCFHLFFWPSIFKQIRLRMSSSSDRAFLLHAAKLYLFEFDMG